jgi:hypothetical protein
MARNVMIALGAILWGIFAAAAISLFLVGHWIAPTITLMVGVPLVGLRLMQRRALKKA